MRHRILFVDDNKQIAEAIGEYFSTHGYQIDCAATAEQALTLIAKSVYSLALVDLRLPGSGIDGFELACRVREIVPWMRVMLFTAAGTSDIEASSMQRGIRIVTKPKPLPHLKKMIEKYLEESYPLAISRAF